MFFFNRTNINEALEECKKTPNAVLLDVREVDEFLERPAVRNQQNQYPKG